MALILINISICIYTINIWTNTSNPVMHVEHFRLSRGQNLNILANKKKIIASPACCSLRAVCYQFVTNTAFIHLLPQSRKEGGSTEEEEEPDVVLVKVERLEEAEPTCGLSIQEGEWNAAGHLVWQ